MLESVIVYFSLFIVMCTCGYLSARRQDLCPGTSRPPFFTPEMVVLLLSFTFIFGFRWGVGHDYIKYYYFYTHNIPDRFEFLFRITSRMLQGIGAHVTVFFSLWAFLDVFLLYYALREYKYLYPYVAFFLIIGSFYLPMMNAIRHYIAALIFLNSIRFIEQKRFPEFAICCILATMFHILSIFLFILYPLLRRKDDWFKDETLQLILFAVAVFIGIYINTIIQWMEVPFTWLTNLLGYEERYPFSYFQLEEFDRTRFGRNTGLGVWVKLLLTLPIIIKSRDLKKYYHSSFFNMLYTLYFIGVLLSSMFEKSVILYRGALFFIIYQLIIYCMFVHYWFSKNDYKYLLVGLMVILIHIPLFFNMITNPRSDTPYLFFWQRALDPPIPFVE